MGWIQRTGSTSGTTGSCDPQCIQQKQEGFAFNIGEGNITVAGQSFCGMTIQAAVRNTFQNAVDEFIPQRCQTFCHFFHFLTSNFCRLAHTYDTGDVFCTGTLFSLLSTAEDQRRNSGAFADIDGTDAFRCPQLMTAHGKQVDIHAVYVNRNMAYSLHSICMEQDAMFFRNFTNFSDWLNGADFIIGKHHGNQDRFGANRLFYILQSYTTKLVHFQISYFHTFLFQIFCSMQDRMMLNFCCNDMFLLFIAGIDHTTQRHIIAFRTAGCKIDLLRLRTDEIRNLCSCMFQCFFTFLRNRIYAGCVTIIFSKVRQDRLQHFFSYRCCCCVIHINSCCHIYSPFTDSLYHIIFICFM